LQKLQYFLNLILCVKESKLALVCNEATVSCPLPKTPSLLPSISHNQSQPVSITGMAGAPAPLPPPSSVVISISIRVIVTARTVHCQLHISSCVIFFFLLFLVFPLWC
jgi:hypothetical protein